MIGYQDRPRNIKHDDGPPCLSSARGKIITLNKMGEIVLTYIRVGCASSDKIT